MMREIGGEKEIDIAEALSFHGLEGIRYGEWAKGLI